MTQLYNDVIALFETMDDKSGFDEICSSFMRTDPFAFSSVSGEEIMTAAGIQFSEVDSYGGEGQGDEFWSVYKFTRGNEEAHIQFVGYYESHHGPEYQDQCEVMAKIVEKIDWVGI
jgi:hypothetical protein